MNKDELIKLELDNLSSIASGFIKQVESTLEVIRKEKVNLYLTQKDIYRLLILRSWTIKYKVSLEYILRNILIFWEAFVQRRSKQMKGRGLNVRVSTLTGKKSEEILKQFIEKDFPNNLNINIWKTSEQERIFRIKETEGIKTVRREIKTLSKYVKHYKYSIRKENTRRERIEKLFQSRPYRDNPFTE
jgi:hypothetical protein